MKRNTIAQLMTQFFNRNVVSIFLFSFLFLLVGCSKTPDWFIGTFEFDSESLTKPHVEKSNESSKPDAKKDDGMFGALKELSSAFAPIAIVKQYGKTTLTITKDEILTMKGGSGNVVKYEIYQMPDKDTVLIRTPENKIETWIKTPTGISKKTFDEMELVIPFKRKL